MIRTLTIVFPILFLVTLFLWRRYKGAGLITPAEVGNMLLGTVVLGVGLLTAAVFFFIVFRINPVPLLGRAAYQLSLGQVVSYPDTIPSRLSDNLRVTNVMRLDTDDDNFEEWVVMYEYDLGTEKTPLQVVIYDNDRGNPPVIFPYELRVPGRDYLSEDGWASFDRAQIDGQGPREIMIRSGNQTELSMFRFRQNSEQWDFPRDAPPRYEAIGYFKGNGGVTYDSATKAVTVIDRGGFDRSQLVARSIYDLNPATATYWDQLYEWSDFNRQLAAPIYTTIDFWNNPPDNVADTTYPEKVVLAFYASACGAEANERCPLVAANWQPSDFLAQDALTEYNSGNMAYFGLAGPAVSQLAVSDLGYDPGGETDTDLAASGQGRDTVVGEQPHRTVIAISFVADNAPLQVARLQMENIDGQWKIVRRLSGSSASSLP